MTTAPSTVVLKNGQARPLAEVPSLAYEVFAQRLLAEVAAGGRVAAYFTAPAGAKDHALYALVARDWRGDLALLRTAVGERFSSLTPRCPQLHLFEREIAEQYGALPEGHPWFKPVRFHSVWQGRDPWGRSSAQHPVPGDMEFYRVAGEEVHEVAVGPVHAGVIEPGHFRFQCHGEKVMHLEISLGYQHRGIESRMPGGPYPSTLFQMETVAGDTTVGHASAYSMILEALGGVAARACGLARDGRLHHPHGAYAESYDHCVIEESGDVFARANIRRRETCLSLEWLRRALHDLPAGEVSRPLPPLAPERLAVAMVEGWRGELVHVGLTDAQGKLARYKIVDPSFHNWSGLAMALRNEQISDFPLCNKSFNLSYCGFDL